MTLPVDFLYLGGCAVRLHRASGPRAIVICPALGVEGLVLHRIVHDLAQSLQRDGHPVLAIDYPGTGDSRDTEASADQVPLWVDGVVRAVQFLRHQPGVRDVVLVGFDLGALLAVLAAARTAVAGVALVGPPGSGRAFVRALVARQAVNGAPDEASRVTGTRGDLEINGFVYSAATLSSLETITVKDLPRAPAPDVLVLGRGGWAPEERLCRELQSLGANARLETLAGYADMRWHSTFSVLAPEAFVGLRRWLAALPPSANEAPSAHDEPADTLAGLGWEESPRTFGHGCLLRGVLCTPAQRTPDVCVLIINHGANRRIGWGGMYVPLARQLAVLGIASFRVDLAGLGDSDRRPNQADRALYDTDYFEDVETALQYLHEQGFGRLALLGHCSGAYHAFHAASRNPRVIALALVNLALFHWIPGTSLDESERKSAKRLGWYVAEAVNPATWRRLVSGRINVGHIASAFARRAGRLIRVRASAALPASTGTAISVVDTFRGFSARGTRVLVVYSDNDGGLDEFSLHCGRGGRRVLRLPGVSLALLPGAGHNVSAQSARALYFIYLQQFLAEAAGLPLSVRPASPSQSV